VKEAARYLAFMALLSLPPIFCQRVNCRGGPVVFQSFRFFMSFYFVILDLHAYFRFQASGFLSPPPLFLTQVMGGSLPTTRRFNIPVASRHASPLEASPFCFFLYSARDFCIVENSYIVFRSPVRPRSF